MSYSNLLEAITQVSWHGHTWQDPGNRRFWRSLVIASLQQVYKQYKVVPQLYIGF